MVLCGAQTVERPVAAAFAPAEIRLTGGTPEAAARAAGAESEASAESGAKSQADREHTQHTPAGECCTNESENKPKLLFGTLAQHTHVCMRCCRNHFRY